MANRYPLVLDTTDGNKIKELPADDNLYLRNNSIVGVQDITALGTIDAARITVDGETIKATSLLDLTDTPASYAGQANQILKVNSTEDGLDFVSFAELGDLTVGNLDVGGDIIPDTTASYDIGSSALEFDQVYAQGFRGDLYDRQGALVFDADTGEIPYAVIIGAPDSLSEFTNDIGYVTQADVNAALAAGITISDFVGSVFGDDSTLLVDGVASRLNPAAIYGEFGGEVSGPSFRTSQLLNEGSLLITTDGPLLTQIIDIQTGGTNGFVNITAPNIQLVGDVVNRVNFEEGIDVKQGITGDVTGSVYYDDSTQIIDAVTGRIVNPTVSGTATFENDVQVDQNLTIAGNLTVQGSTTSVETVNTTIKDNVITLNQGEAGAGVTGVTSGIEIDRGSEANKTFVWDDSVDKWTLGSETLAAGRFESVGVAASIIDSPLGTGLLQIKAGDVSDSGNVIFINPYGSNTFINSTAETHYWGTGPYLSTGNPYIDFKTAGAFTAHDGAYFVGDLTGNVVGDIKGSVFGDDSTVIVDAVNNNLNADTLNVSTIESAGVLGINPLALAISTQAGISVAAGAGPLSLASDGSAVYMTGNSGAGSISYNDANGAIILVTTGLTRIEGAAGGNINIGTGTSGTVTLGNGSNTVGFTSGTTLDFDGATVSNFTGNVTGNIDNVNLDLGFTNATQIRIGNSGSTTTIDGTIQFTNALIANNLRADDSISITTATGDGNAITLSPQGTNTAVNINADSIRLLGDLTDNLSAVGGVTGDLKGSVVGDDSTIIVDGVNNSVNLNGTVKGNIVPDLDIAYDIGSITNRFRDLYLSGNTINLGNTTISAAGSNFSVGAVINQVTGFYDQAGEVISERTSVSLPTSTYGPYTQGYLIYDSLDLDPLTQPIPGNAVTRATYLGSSDFTGEYLEAISGIGDGGEYFFTNQGDDIATLFVGPADPDNEPFVADGTGFAEQLFPGFDFPNGTYTATYTASNTETLSVTYTVSGVLGNKTITVDNITQSAAFPAGEAHLHPAMLEYQASDLPANLFCVDQTDPTNLVFDYTNLPDIDSVIQFYINGNLTERQLLDTSGNPIFIFIEPVNAPANQSAKTLSISQIVNIGISFAPPATPIIGDIALADGINWDPVSTGKLSLVIYLGSWVQIAVAP